MRGFLAFMTGLGGVITLLAAAFSLLSLITDLHLAQSAPQQAAVAAMDLSYVVIPYCWTRVFGMMLADRRADDARKLQEEILAALKVRA
jgi:hypothetical protein